MKYEMRDDELQRKSQTFFISIPHHLLQILLGIHIQYTDVWGFLCLYRCLQKRNVKNMWNDENGCDAVIKLNFTKFIHKIPHM